ncbi:MAG: transposase [Anaerolineae bacterium]
MLRDRYEMDKLFASIAGVAGRMEPELTQIDAILDDDGVYALVRGDLERRYPRTTRTGRPSTPVEVILRMLVVKHLYGLSYEQTEAQVADSLVLRQFCRVYCQAVPDDTTLMRWANEIRPRTLEALNRRVLGIASRAKVTRARKLRTDGTLVETNVHPPSDSSLLADGVRVLSRLIGRAKPLVEAVHGPTKAVFRDRTRSSKGLAREIASRARGGTGKAKAAYVRLLGVTQASVAQAKTVLASLREQSGAKAAELGDGIAGFIGRVEQVIAQTKQRVLAGESVAAADKLVSLFEPHTGIIKRGKVGKPAEFDRKVWLDEVDGGLVSGWRVLEGNAPDQRQWWVSLDKHNACSSASWVAASTTARRGWNGGWDWASSPATWQ